MTSFATSTDSFTFPAAVRHRNGSIEPFCLAKIVDRVTEANSRIVSAGKSSFDPVKFATNCANELTSEPTTREIDEYLHSKAIACLVEHPDYGAIAVQLLVSSYQKDTCEGLLDAFRPQLEHVDPYNNRAVPLISEGLWEIANEFEIELNDMLDFSRDYNFSYFGFKTMMRGYLGKVEDKYVERPQHMWMRVALGLHLADKHILSSTELLESIRETYGRLSRNEYIHATPTLSNAGRTRPQLSSCFLVPIREDSLVSIYEGVSDAAIISQHGGGIGFSIHNIRATNSRIFGTNGESKGIVPMLKVFNDTALHCDQGGSKRKGAIAMYLEPWHADILPFLDLKKKIGAEHARARDLFYALWIPDLFMRRARDNQKWSLMCPNKCPGLDRVYGEEFDALYEKYEAEGKYDRQIPAQELWFAILTAQMETGTPYMMYKDACNFKSNQRNLGTIRGSNLCAEIVEYTSKEETAVCNLATIGLPNMIGTMCDEKGNVTKFFNYDKLHDVVRCITRNLNRVIDVNYYPTKEAMTSNQRHRPIGIGVQGLADVFMEMAVPYYSDAAKELNKLIFETIYHAALSESCLLAEKFGPYGSFHTSPAAEGILQYDMWNVTPTEGRYDWAQLKANIKEHGLRNSLLVALPPTASTSQILGFNECFEAYTSNIYMRRVLTGEYAIINKHLTRDLIARDLWTPEIRQSIIDAEGSVQGIQELPQELRDIYKTAWEISPRHSIDMAADRGAYVCQSQSMNLWVEQPTPKNLTPMHFYAWKKGLKTGIYYLRRKGAHKTQAFTIEPKEKIAAAVKVASPAPLACPYKSKKERDEAEANGEQPCEACSA